MADKRSTMRSELDNTFKSTETGSKTPADGTIPATGRTVSVGVGLKESEVAMLDEVADAFGVSRNALMRYALRYFLMQYQAKEIELKDDVETQDPKKRLKMPGMR